MKILRACKRIGLTLLAAVPAGLVGATLDYTRGGGPVEFGAAELEAALPARAVQGRVRLSVGGGGAPESFRVRVHGEGAARAIRIECADAAGAMYGAMEVGAPLPLTASVMEILQTLKHDDSGNSDHGAIVRYFEKLTKIELRRAATA